MNPVLRTAIVLVTSIVIIGVGWNQVTSLRARVATTREEITVLQTNLVQARADMARAISAREQIEQHREILRTFDTTAFIPPDEAFIRAHGEFATMATASGLKALSIIESSDRPPVPDPSPDGPYLTPYRLSAELSGTEAAAIRFARAIEEANPHVVFHHFSILDRKNGEPCTIFATIEWPMWNGADKAAAIKTWREQTL